MVLICAFARDVLIMGRRKKMERLRSLRLAAIVWLVQTAAVVAEDDKYRGMIYVTTFATAKETDWTKKEFLIVSDGQLRLLLNDQSGDENRRAWRSFADRTIKDDPKKPFPWQVQQGFGDGRYVAYDLTGKETAARLIRDFRNPATQWIRIPHKDGGFHLSPANGVLKGWYLDFEKPIAQKYRPPSTKRDETIYLSRAILSEKPSERSRLATSYIVRLGE
jgi:hypothetical protein